MFDRNVIETWLEICGKNGSCSPRCPYGDEYEVPNECRKHLMTDAFTLLKEQEASEPKTGHWTYLQNCANEGVYCSECHTKMFDRYPMKKKLSQFCGHCGAKMEGAAKWE